MGVGFDCLLVVIVSEDQGVDFVYDFFVVGGGLVNVYLGQVIY